MVLCHRVCDELHIPYITGAYWCKVRLHLSLKHHEDLEVIGSDKLCADLSR